MSTLELTRAHRAELITLTGLAARDLELIWAEFNKADAVAVRNALAEILPRLVAMYGAAAATLGADWYDEMRDAAEIDGRFTAITAHLPDIGRTDALAGWAVTPLFQAEPDAPTALEKAKGGLQRIIADADRQTVMASAVADPQAQGWQRTGSGECGFCSMLIGRGTVYSEASANFASHDHCHCGCVPAWGGQPLPVAAFVPSSRQASDADRARVREYIKTH